MKITVSVTNDLVIDQRVHKVCTTLLQNGYDVTLVGRRLRHSLPVSRPYRLHRMRLLFDRSFLFYAEYNIRLFFYLLFDPTDAYLSNDTDTLPANFFASRLRRKPLIFDAHEMFPEVPEVVHRPFVKAVWTRIEDFLFPRLKHTYTVCRSIADSYNRKYGLRMQVVRNIPPASAPVPSSPPLIDARGKKVLLYQGAVNTGRGIERIVDAMSLLPEFVFYIVGDGDVLSELKDRVNRLGLADRVFFTGRIPFERLSDYTACADIGINLLENRGLNYYYSLPNRIFDYIRAGIPVLTVDFPEIRRIVSHYNVGVPVDRFDPLFLSQTLRRMAVEPKNIAGFATANAELTWKNEAKVLMEVVTRAMEGVHGGRLPVESAVMEL
jgi:glycosyltransferase involved in cell wall biosynthesis